MRNPLCVEMNKDTEKQNIINASDDAYRNAVFDALMYYQEIESLLRDCILKSYEIINATSHELVNFKPDKRHIDNIKSRMGLGGLVETFRTITNRTDLCDRIKKETKKRNFVAHAAASKYLKFPISDNGARDCQSASDDIFESATIASWIYEELVEIRNEIEEIHGKVV